MMSGSPFRTSTTTVTDPARQSLRLTLKPMAAMMGVFDGGWWPRSTDPIAEFPALVAGLGIRLGEVQRIGFNMTTWAAAPGRITVDGHLVRLEGFHSMDEHTVTVYVSDVGWLHLFVVPPDATDEEARTTLITAAASDTTTEGSTEMSTSRHTIAAVRRHRSN